MGFSTSDFWVLKISRRFVACGLSVGEVLQTPIAYILAIKLDWKQTGVFWAVVISESILAVLAMLYFKTGRWKKNTIDF
jgi:Na+-driven multidrug efflux pump